MSECIFFFWKEKNLIVSFQRLRSKLSFLSYHQANTGERMVHQEGHVLETLARRWGRSPCVLPAWDNCHSPAPLTHARLKVFPSGKPPGKHGCPSAAAPWEGCLLHWERCNVHLLQAQEETQINLRHGRVATPWCPHRAVLEGRHLRNHALCLSARQGTTSQGWEVLQQTKQTLLFLLKP